MPQYIVVKKVTTVTTDIYEIYAKNEDEAISLTTDNKPITHMATRKPEFDIGIRDNS